MKDGVKSPAFLTTGAIIILGLLALMVQSESPGGALYFLPFTLGPLLISLLLASVSLHRTCQIILIGSSVLYGLWFSLVYLSAFYRHLDPQSSFALLFIGVFSLPVMIPVWIATLVIRRKQRLMQRLRTDSKDLE